MTKKIVKNNCPIRATLKIIGGKWKLLIIYQVKEEKKRFGELLKILPDITKQMLTKNLRELEKDGIINRKIYPVVPPKVEYSLTKDGETLIPVLEIIEAWGKSKLTRNTND